MLAEEHWAAWGTESRFNWLSQLLLQSLSFTFFQVPPHLSQDNGSIYLQNLGLKVTMGSLHIGARMKLERRKEEGMKGQVSLGFMQFTKHICFGVPFYNKSTVP